MKEGPASRPIAFAPGDNGLPLVGETISFLKDPVTFVDRRASRHGSVFRTRLFGRNTAVLLGAEANRFVFSDGMDVLRWKDGWPPNFPALLGDALFLQDGEEHRRKRNLLMPAFHSEAIASYLRTIDERLQRCLKRWEGLGTFPFYDEFHRLTFEVSSALFLGANLDADGVRLNALIDRWVSGLVALPVPLPWTAFGRALRVRKELLEFAERAITERRGSPKADALGLLVGYRDDSGAELTLDELKSQALFLVAAGYATTTSMLTSLVHALAVHPEMLARARAEQADFVAGHCTTLEDLKRMPYLDKVLCEVERCFPPVAFGFRGVAEPFDFAGFSVPAGWQVMHSITATHKNPEYFPDPERFDPERFADDRADRRAFKLVGFGGGPRVCLGMTLARTQIKVIVSNLLRGYAWDIEAGQDMRVVFMPARRPRDGLRVRFRKVG